MTKLAILAAVLSATLVADGQGRDDTLRRMLATSGFATLAEHFPLAELDRPLNSSRFTYDRDRFVAALYFADEMPGQYQLGPVHLLRVDRSGAILRADLPELRGTVMSISLGTPILISTHITPSAGHVAVLDQHLKPIKLLDSYWPERLPGGRVFYRGNMVHFADVHQQTLHVFDPASGVSSELYPVAEWPAALRGYDRSIREVQFNASGDVIAFALGYNRQGMPYGYERQTVVRCQRALGKWACRGRQLESAARGFGIALPEDIAMQNPIVSSVLERELLSRR